MGTNRNAAARRWSAARAAVIGLSLVAGGCACSIAEPAAGASRATEVSRGPGQVGKAQAGKAPPPAKAAPPHADTARLSDAITRLLPPAPPAPSAGAGAQVAIHIADADTERLGLAIAKALEIVAHHRSGRARAAVELVVEAGPGRVLADAGSSPGQALRALVAVEASLAVTICDGGDVSAKAKARGATGAVIPRARHTASCGARLIALRQAGYAYIRP